MTRDEGGEREFSGFGAAKNNEYADCFIDGDKIPESTIKVSKKTDSNARQACQACKHFTCMQCIYVVCVVLDIDPCLAWQA